jgi:hypothetical protein
MIRIFTVIILLTTFFTNVYSQEVSTSRKGISRPNLPGNFVLELGVNQPINAPSDFKKGFWGSRTLNIYYQHDMRIGQSNFSFLPGIGLSLERFKFTNGGMIGYQNDSLRVILPANNSIKGIRKSQLVTNYIEVPLELCYRTNPEDPARSFKASIGGRIGYMYDAFSKVKYKEDGEVKKLKDKQFYDLNRFRYGALVKIGVGNFSVFGYYNLNSLFESKGAYGDFNTATIGISLTSF